MESGSYERLSRQTVTGKVALVTGGATEIGRDIAEAVVAARCRGGALPAGMNRTAASNTGDHGIHNGAVPADSSRTYVSPSRLALRDGVVAGQGARPVINNTAGNFLCPSAMLSPNGLEE